MENTRDPAYSEFRILVGGRNLLLERYASPSLNKWGTNLTQQRPHDIETELNRDIGLIGAVAIGVGTMIAAGIFVLSGLAVGKVGAASVVSFLLAALVASFTAFAYAEFASIYTESGGGYMYVANVFDTDLTYIVGWSMILGYPASAAFYIASFSDWFSRFIYPALDIPAAAPYWLSGLVVLGLIVAINLKGTEETGMFQIVVTGLKVALIALFLYGGLAHFDPSVVRTSLSENIGRFREIGITSALVFITFFGFEAIATNAEEIEDPGRNVPRAIFLSMGIVTLVYLLVVTVIVVAMQDSSFLQLLIERSPGIEGQEAALAFIKESGEIAMGRAAQHYLGEIGFYVIILGALFSMISAANATVMAGSRVKLAMSRRDHLPGAFEDLHPSLDTPYKSVLLTGSLILLYILIFSIIFGSPPGAEGHAPLGIEAMAHFADFMLLIGLVFVNLALVRSRRKNPEIERQFEVPFVPYVPYLAILANLVLLVNVEPKSFALGIGAEAAGIAFWFVWKSRTPPVEKIERETPTVVAEHEPLETGYQLLVPIADPEHVDQMMNTACDIAEDHGGEVLVVTVVELPAQTPLSEGRQFVEERRTLLDRAMEEADERDVPVSGVVRIGHDVSKAILNTVQQHGSDAVLMGWRHRPRRRDFVLGSNVDAVVMDANCDVLVEKIAPSPAGTADSVLVPIAGGPNAEYALEVAGAIARANDSKVKLLNVASGETDEDEALTILSEAEESMDWDKVESRLVHSDDVSGTILAEEKNHQVTVIGATREGMLQQLVMGALPEEVGREAENTVIMVKKNLGIRSKLSQWLHWE